MKRVWCILFALSMVLGMLPAMTIAASAATSGDYTYTVLEDNTAEIIAYKGWDFDLAIPSTLGGYTVSSIGNGVFSGRGTLGTVTIPSSVKTIGDGAFKDCDWLTSVTISEGVTAIGVSAFEDCDWLTSITIPSSVTTIGDSAFYECDSLKKGTISEGVTTIGDSAFKDCDSLTSITIPSSVTTVGKYAFYNCDSMTQITVASDNMAYSSKDGILFDKTKTLLICCPQGKRGAVTIPSSVTTIGDSAFHGCSDLESISIPSSVTTIGNSAFASCALTSVTIPSSVTTMGDTAFGWCNYLISVTISEGVTTIGDSAFYCCFGLTSVTIPSSVTTIGDGAFISCESLTSVTIPEGVLTIGDSAFRGCGRLHSITIPSSVTVIGDGAFEYCAGLTSITIPSSVTIIENATFSGCDNLSSVTIPEGVTTIGKSAFSSCRSLESISIPSSVTTIGKSAFSYCDSLTQFTVASDNRAYSSKDGVLFDKAKTTLLYYPQSKQGTLYNIPTSVTFIGDYAFYDCTSLTSIAIPSSVTTIGERAFSSCTSLTSITIPASVTTIGERAFSSCTSLTSVAIPSSVTAIGDSAFAYCDNLTSITIPSSVTTISDEMFYHCDNLTSITIPEGATTIGDYAFYGCGGLTSITIPSSVTTIGYMAFDGCGSLTSVTIPSSVTTIEACAFDGCTGLTSIAIPSSVTTIGVRAFCNCKSLTSITIPSSVTNIGNFAFDGCKSITDVYYDGTEAQWNFIYVGGNNDPLQTATVHYDCSFANITAESDMAAYASIDQNVSVKVTATGDGLSYTWYVKNPGQTKYSKSSITTDTYKTKMTVDNSGRLVYCVVEDQYGNQVRSKTFLLCAKAAITAESDPVAYASNGKVASVNVTAAGQGLSYTWYTRDPGQTKYYKSSITSATYKAKMTEANSGRLVYCIVGDEYGNGVRSKTFVLRMQASITSEPATAAYAKMGEKVSVKIGAAGDGLTYTWYVKNANATKYVKSSISSATYSATMSDAVKGRRIYCVVKDKYGKTAQTKTFILREAVSITAQPKTAYAKNGATVKTTVAARGDGLTYTWYVKNAGQTKYTKSSVTKATYSTTMNSKAKNRLLYCVVKDAYGKSVKSTTVQLKMK